MADWGCDDAVGGGAEGRVGESVLVGVDALWHLRCWWLVVGVGGSEQLLVVGVWWKRAALGGCWLVLVLVSSESYCEIGLGKSLRGLVCLYCF